MRETFGAITAARSLNDICMTGDARRSSCMCVAWRRPVIRPEMERAADGNQSPRLLHRDACRITWRSARQSNPAAGRSVDTSQRVPCQPSEVNHDERYDAWNDVGHGAPLVVGRHCLDPGGRSTRQIPPLRRQSEPTMRMFVIVALATSALLSPAVAEQGDVSR